MKYFGILHRTFPVDTRRNNKVITTSRTAHWLWWHTFVGLFLIRSMYIAHKRTDELSWTKRGSNSQPSDWGNIASCQLSSTFLSHQRNCAENTAQMVGLMRHWTFDKAVWIELVSTPCVCVNFELGPDSGNIRLIFSVCRKYHLYKHHYNFSGVSVTPCAFINLHDTRNQFRRGFLELNNI